MCGTTSTQSLSIACAAAAGKSRSLQVNSQTTWRELAAALEHTASPPEMQRLIYRGRQLLKTSTLASVGMRSEDSVEVVLR